MSKDKRGLFEPDPRVKILLFIIGSILIFSAGTNFMFIWGYCVIICLYLIRGLYKQAIRHAIVLTIFVVLQQLIYFTDSIASVLLMIVQQMAVFVIFGSWVVTNMFVSDFIAATQKMKMPEGLTIALAVMFRFLPTIREEFSNIKNTMKLRGIAFSPKNIFLTPLKTIEYTLVPLAIKSLRIADQLSAAAMARGLNLETKRSSYNHVKLGLPDYLLFVVTLGLFALGFYFNNTLV